MAGWSNPDGTAHHDCDEAWRIPSTCGGTLNVLTFLPMNPLAFFGGSTGGGELMLIMLVALLLFGAKSLPQIARTIGKTLEQVRRAASEVRAEVMNAEQEMSETSDPPKAPPALPAPRPPEEDADERVAR